MKRAIYLLTAILALALAGCSVESGNGQFHAGDPVREVRAEATAVAVVVAKGNADIDLQVRQADLQHEIASHDVALQATVTAYTTQMSTTLIVAKVEADAQARAIEARGQAEANRITAYAERDVRTSQTLASAVAIAIPMVALAVGLAAMILALGHSVATVKRAVLTAGYVTIGVEKPTLLPPPLVVHGGYLIDTRSGERAALKDPAGVDRMRLGAMAHTTETALVARAHVAIARATKNPKAGDALMAAVNTLPTMVDAGDVPPMIEAGDNGKGGNGQHELSN